MSWFFINLFLKNILEITFKKLVVPTIEIFIDLLELEETLPSPSKYPRINGIISHLYLNIFISGKVRFKDLFGVHPYEFNVSHKCLLPTPQRHLAYVLPLYLTFPSFTLFPLYCITILVRFQVILQEFCQISV